MIEDPAPSPYQKRGKKILKKIKKNYQKFQTTNKFPLVKTQ